jgi:hypothetical protein
MTTLKTTGGDLAIEGSNLVLLDGREMRAQQIRQRLSTSRGGNRYNLRLGVPYVQTILRKTTSLTLIRDVYAEVLRETPFVAEIVRLDVERNPSSRELCVSGIIRDVDGNDITVEPVDVEVDL